VLDAYRSPLTAVADEPSALAGTVRVRVDDVVICAT
jgi:hypothetical protein